MNKIFYRLFISSLVAFFLIGLSVESKPFVSVEKNFQIDFPKEPTESGEDWQKLPENGVEYRYKLYVTSQKEGNREEAYLVMVGDYKIPDGAEANAEKMLEGGLNGMIGEMQNPVIINAEHGKYSNYKSLEASVKAAMDGDPYYLRCFSFLKDDLSDKIIRLYGFMYASTDLSKSADENYRKFKESFKLF